MEKEIIDLYNFYNIDNSKFNQLKDIFKDDNFDFENVDIDDFIEKVKSYMNTLHPLLYKSNLEDDSNKKVKYDNHLKKYNNEKRIIEMYMKKEKIDRFVDKKVRKYFKDYKLKLTKLTSLDREELSSIIEETIEVLNEMDRGVSRKFPQKDQIEYFNSMFDITGGNRMNVNDPLNNFFNNPIQQVMGKREYFENNHRLENENEISYETIKVSDMNIIRNEESLMNNMEDFNREFEKRRNNHNNNIGGYNEFDGMVDNYYGLMSSNDLTLNQLHTNMNLNELSPEQISKMRDDNLFN